MQIHFKVGQSKEKRNTNDSSFFCCQDDWTYQPIINWNNLAKNMPWGALLLLGAGLSVASAFQVSKLSLSVAHALKFLAKIPRAGVIMLIIVISGLFTEVTSNLSTASIFFPVLDSVVILKIEQREKNCFFSVVFRHDRQISIQHS